MIDLITGHQGVAHISADQIASINNAMMDNYGANKVMRLIGGELTANGLTIEVGTGYWRANGFDMEVQEAETIYIDPTAAGLSRIDNIYVEILQDIPTGAQRSEIVTVNGEPSATPTAPEAPTAPELNTDILLQVVPLASVTVTEGAMVMTDLTIAYEMVTPSELEAVETIATGAQTTASNAQTAAGNAQTTANTASTNATNALNMIRSTSSDAYSSSKAYSVGDHVIYNNKVYKCITACSPAAWSVNQNCFEETTLTTVVTELNSDLTELDSNLSDLDNVVTKVMKPCMYMWYGANIDRGVIAPQQGGAGAVFLLPFGTKKVHFTLDNNANVQAGVCDSGASLPSIINSGTGRGTYKNYTTSGNSEFTVGGSAGWFFIGSASASSSHNKISNIWCEML
jgi:hypothetical protein